MRQLSDQFIREAEAYPSQDFVAFQSFLKATGVHLASAWQEHAASAMLNMGKGAGKTWLLAQMAAADPHFEAEYRKAQARRVRPQEEVG
jgi:hypothetical protein